MSHRIYVLLCVFWVIQSSAIAQNNGTNWTKLDREAKLNTVIGMVEGLQLGSQFTVWGRGLSETDRDFAEPIKKFHYFEDNYVLRVPYGRILEGIDWVYSDPANSSVDYPYAMWIALNKHKGQDADTLMRMCVAFRRDKALTSQASPADPFVPPPADPFSPPPSSSGGTVPMRSAEPEPQTVTPNTTGVLFDAYPGVAGRGELTITNGTTSVALVKMIDSVTSRKIWSAVIMPGDVFPVGGYPDGTFDVIFAFGERLVKDSDNLYKPHGFAKFDSPFRFVTTQDAAGVRYTTFKITLNPVVGGNAKTTKIDESEFNRY